MNRTSPIRSILVHADASERWAERLPLAVSIAAAFDADVTTLYAVDPAWVKFPIAFATSAAAAAILFEVEEQRLSHARANFDRATSGLARELRWLESSKNPPDRAVTSRALCADLVILGQPETGQEADTGLPHHFVESVVIDSGRPVLVVPYIGAPASTGSVALVAWKNTRESARALSASIPLLQRAQRVHVATWPEGQGEDGEAPDVEQYLRRHGIEPTMRRCGAATGAIGEAILSLAADVSADLLVMGFYGHSRSRERVLGGASRSILGSMTLPVLMAH